MLVWDARALTVRVSILRHGVDLLVGQDLHVLAAGPAVQLVDPNQPAAHAVCHFALLAYMLREIRRGLIGYLSEIRYGITIIYSPIRVLFFDFVRFFLSFFNKILISADPSVRRLMITFTR